MNLETVKQIAEKYPVLRYAAVLLLGIAVGAIFYPTKRIEERVKMEYEAKIEVIKQEYSKEVASITEEHSQLKKKYSSYKKSSEKKIEQLTTLNTELKKRTKTSYVKIIHPDGTVEVRKETESDIDESTKVVTQLQEEYRQRTESMKKEWQEEHDKKISDIQKEFSSKEQQYKEEISKLESSKVTEINVKKFGLEAGILTNANYYMHGSADLFGPIFVGAHGEAGKAGPAMGLGLGLRF